MNLKRYLLTMIFFILAATISLLSIDKTQNGFCITKTVQVATANEDDLDDAITYIRNRQRDKLSEMIDSDMATILQPGTKVKKVMHGNDPEKIFIEIPGKKIGVWTMSNAVVCE